MRRVVVLLLLSALAAVGLTACMSDDDNESAASAQDRRSAALVSSAEAGGYQLIIDGLTPAGQAIEGEAYSWGATATTSTTSTLAGRVTVNDLKIVKSLDQTSPLLFQGLAQAKHYLRAELALKTTGGEVAKPAPYMKYLLEDVVIEGIEHSGTNPNMPQEQVTIGFRKITQEYSGSGDSKLSTPLRFGWDLASATKL